MFAVAALFLVALSGPTNLRALDLAPQTFAPPTFAARGEVFEQSPWLLDVALQSPRFELDGRASRRDLWLAQRVRRHTDAVHPAPAPAPAPELPPEPTPPAASPAAPCASCDIDCETCRESDRQARYVLHRRAAVLRTHRAFAIATWASMLLTEVLGAGLAVNQPTWWGEGNCLVNNQTRIFGPDFGCGGGLQGLHEGMAFITTGLYVTTAVLAIGAPDPDDASAGDDTAARTLRLHKSMAWIHGIGMLVLPILGLLSVHPEMFLNAHDPNFADESIAFQRTLRSIHTIVGVTTLAALTVSGYLELF